MKTCLLALIFVAGSLPAHAQYADHFKIERVADGVYTAIQEQPAEPVEGNSTIIINDSDVVVVDTRTTPASGRALIAAIRQLTTKPVRYVINTHWHRDHHYGNDAFRQAYPGVEIIGHVNEREDLLTQDTDTLLHSIVTEIIPDLKKNVSQILASGKRSNGLPLDAADSSRLRWLLGSYDFQAREFETTRITPPTMTVSDKLVLYRGQRTIEVRYLGRANTRGDLVVYLPRERVLITGDVVVNPIPFAFGSFFSDWLGVLGSMHALPMDALIPGHGPVQHDWQYVDRLARLFRSTLDQAKSAVAQGKDLAATRASINLDSLRDEFTGTDRLLRAQFDAVFVTPGVERAFLEARGELKP